MPILEMCVDSLGSALAAEAGGADRIELCSGLAEGGMTPSLGLLRAARARVGLRVHVMIRPRPGNFVYAADEIAVMRDDIHLAQEHGADGVVFGLLNAHGEVDLEATAAMVAYARPMAVTFHRAFDVTRDLGRALHDVIATGADCVLTSGGKLSAAEAMPEIRALVQAAGDGIRVMVGGGVRAENVESLARSTGASDFHAALQSLTQERASRSTAQHASRPAALFTQESQALRSEDVRALREALDAVHANEAPLTTDRRARELRSLAG